MRHLKGRRKLNRNGSHRSAMLRNMVTSLLRYERITTTESKAKELRPIVERVITLSKRSAALGEAASEEERVVFSAKRLHAIRIARRWVNDSKVLKQLFSEYGVRYQDRSGGYTRIVKLGYRAGDNAPMSMIQLLPAISVEDSTAG